MDYPWGHGPPGAGKARRPRVTPHG